MKSSPTPIRWDFSGDCVVVSGGARGIGAGLVSHFACSGATVIFGDVDTVGAAELVRELGDLPVHFVEVDFSQADAWPKLLTHAEAKGLSPNLVISNVGIGHYGPVEQTTVEAFDRVFHTNVRSAWLAARTFGETLAKNHGSLILVGSVMASFGMEGQSLYSASKAALSGLLRNLCVEYGPKGVRVNMIVPGYIINDPPSTYRKEILPALWREFHRRFSKDAAEANPPVQPLPFWGEPDDIAQAASFLHSQAARYITGAELRIDGGLLCQAPIRPNTGNQSWQWTPEMRDWLSQQP